MGKAVTIAEITRRRLRGLYQNTQIGLARPTGEAAASTSEPRQSAQPTITIVLSMTALDPNQPGWALT